MKRKGDRERVPGSLAAVEDCRLARGWGAGVAEEGVVTLSYLYILNILCNAYFQLERTVGSGSHGMWHLSFRTV